MENFIMQFELDSIDAKICDDIIEYHKNNTDYKTKGQSILGKGDKISIDVHVGSHNQNPIIKKYLTYITKCVIAYKMKFNDFLSHLSFEEGFNIQHYLPKGGFPKWHNERSMHQTHQRALVFMTYLNDVTDGGGTDFKYQNLRVSAKKGTTLIWPTDFTHTHRGEISPTQEKYIATGWLIHSDVKMVLGHEKMLYQELETKYKELLDKTQDLV